MAINLATKYASKLDQLLQQALTLMHSLIKTMTLPVLRRSRSIQLKP